MPVQFSIRLLCSIASVALLAGCGIKGPLYLPTKNAAGAPKAPQSASPDVSKPSPGTLPTTPDQPGG